MKIDRKKYAELYGPTVGDKIRLGDTELIIEIEKDFTTYGEEVVFGAGKNIRDGMGQTNTKIDAPDLVITNVIILDYTGIVKADIGIKNGYICGIGKAGNPDTMDNVTPGLEIGPFTEIISGEGLIATAGAVDKHVHFISPQIVYEALSNGVTTLIGGGDGPTTGTNATNATPGPWNIHRMLEAIEEFPVNIGLIGKGNSSNPKMLIEQLKEGAMGFKIHEDWGATPNVIDVVLDVADEYDVMVALHTDTPNEAGYVENTIASLKGRTIHTYHSEGAGGGHAPDILRIAGLPNVLPSSTTPTLPATINTVTEHVDMLIVCHHLKPEVPEDVAFAKSRIRAQTILAEDVLHDMGVISIVSSDSQAMGRIGETVLRTWQMAHSMKVQRGKLPEDSEGNDNFRVKRYIAKYTINPAIACGVSKYVGSIEPGKLADIVLWDPKFFGVKPSLVLKSGFVVWSLMGDANASIPTCEPYMYKPMFGSFGKARQTLSLTFVSKLAYENDIKNKLKLNRQFKPVEECRQIGKKNMIFNDFVGEVYVDPKTYEVFVNGTKIESNFMKELPLAQRYFLF
ncbi:urease, alpha subunit [Thermodesulfatator indicus DSM 15286]|uniref:Urease subunit alpha n=1 Tax=Thermodesulfatator indicus (strain DSM 15286 / JCM 11887 / CIR29812) TaxID=667014 RepID=F8A814_THEID|nr:urease subunit alpha [Thermodesulfatator indicus]AEH45007.1 urease, alpha subunit [Thermodesulfatator indicus DSM 15286]